MSVYRLHHNWFSTTSIFGCRGQQKKIISAFSDGNFEFFKNITTSKRHSVLRRIPKAHTVNNRPHGKEQTRSSGYTRAPILGGVSLGGQRLWAVDKVYSLTWWIMYAIPYILATIMRSPLGCWVATAINDTQFEGYRLCKLSNMGRECSYICQHECMWANIGVNRGASGCFLVWRTERFLPPEEDWLARTTVGWGFGIRCG